MSFTPISQNFPVSSSQRQPSANSVRGQAASESDASETDLFWAYYRYLKAQRPRFFEAVAQDAIVFAYHRGEVKFVRAKARRILYALLLPFRASEYLELVLYPLRSAIRSAHVPLLPSIIGAICGVVWGIRIGDPVVMDEGVYIPHGQIVIDGLVYIGKGSELCPWITIGLRGALADRGLRRASTSAPARRFWARSGWEQEQRLARTPSCCQTCQPGRRLSGCRRASSRDAPEKRRTTARKLQATTAGIGHARGRNRVRWTARYGHHARVAG